MNTTVLDNPDAYKKIDPDGMLKLVEEFPSQAKEAYEIGQAFDPPSYSDLNGVLILGMGGSAIGGDLIKSYTEGSCPVPVQVNRGYGLPKWVNEKTLVIASSYSGDTEETLDSYYEAKSRNAKVIAITTGGKIRVNAEDRGDPYIIIRKGYSPRAALGFSFFPMLALFAKLGLVPNQDDAVREAIDVVSKCCKAYGRDVATDDNPAKKLARTLEGKLPIIYSSVGAFEPVGYRFRCQINENSKALASSHTLPEMNHNEIVGWSGNTELTQHFHIIYLRDKGNHPQVTRRFDIMKPIIEPHSAGVTEVTSGGDGLLARMFSLISLGDFVSVYLAVLLESDPTPVDNISRLKKELA